MIRVREEDLEVTFLKGSGPGGQHRNVRETGVRIRHVPTGIVVTATERRSQVENRRVALERLEQALARRLRRRRRRVPTRPTRASKVRRVKGKKIHSRKKALRRKPTPDGA